MKNRLNHNLARMTLWPGHFVQKATLARVTIWPVTLWPETLWPERHFGPGRRDSLASDTLAKVTLWPVFLASFGVPRVNKNSIGGTIGKN